MIYTFNLNNKVVLITGGYGYLGSAVVESLLYHGAKVYVLGRDIKKYEDSFSSLFTDYDSRLCFEKCDVSNTSSIKQAYRNIYLLEEKIDILINNAFYSKGQSPEEMTDSDWELGIDGTLNSVFRCIREIIPYFKEQNKGKIINVSSMYGMVAPDFNVYVDSPEFLNPPHYGASKAGIIQLTKYYASYLGKFGINVNCVTPGPFPSLEVQKIDGFINLLEDNTLLGRIGNPEDLAGAFIYLGSDTSNYVTGQNIVIDGGWTTK